ncbi:MAG: hypothetical protein V7785_10635 [Bermanella sp.]
MSKSEQGIYLLGDIAGGAQIKIQQDFSDIDPIIGISHHLRTAGFPIDAMTIDCLTSGKRILMLLNDSKPDWVSYQFGFKGKDPAVEFEGKPLKEVDETQIYNWIKQYFSS